MRRTLVTLAVVSFFVFPAALSSQELPPDNEHASQRLEASARHGEWIKYDVDGADSVSAWLVFPERSDDAPVVVVIHEIFGLTDWVRSVADQLAADGFIAIAPDLLSGKGPNGGGTESLGQDARRAIRDLDRGEVTRRLEAAARYGVALPAARNAVASIGFCWGGSTSFRLATTSKVLGAAVVYYGSSPPNESLATVEARVLGLYGGNDARVTATIEPAQQEMRRLGKNYEVHVFDGAGHGFLRAQSGQDGANMRASRQAWPRTVAFLRETLGR